MSNQHAKKVITLFLFVIMIFSVTAFSAFAQENPVTNVESASELETALVAGAEKICITSDFEIDRTFFITYNVNIYSNEPMTLIRKADFAGDFFVIGESSDGIVCEEKVTLSVGKADAQSSDMLTIDGNKENMTADVNGTIFFVCKNGQADLYSDITVTNCATLAGNERAKDSKYTLNNNRSVIGGPVAVIAEAAKADPGNIKDGVMNIYGGKYLNNGAVGDELYGGVIFNHSKLYVYDGLFKGNTATRAGAFYNYRDIYIYKATVQNNTASSMGGAVYMPDSSGARMYLTGEESEAGAQIVFKNNSSKYAGAIYTSGRLVMRNVLFDGNSTSKSSGGAIYGGGDYVNIVARNCEFKNNTATTSGGAIIINGHRSSEKVDLNIQNSVFSNNTANGDGGGAIYLAKNTTTYVRDSSFSNNTTTGSGGVIYSKGAVAQLNNVTLTENSSTGAGGAIYIAKDTNETENGETVDVPSELIMNKVTATKNSSGGRGGAFYSDTGVLKAYNSTFSQNTAKNSGSALCFYTCAAGELYNCVIEKNYCADSVTGNAGAMFIYTNGKKVTLNTCTIKENTSKGCGGAITISKASLLDMFNITATDNSAAKGGFMYATTTGTTITISGCTVSGNTATEGGPIIWGNSAGAKLYINKANYTDKDVETELDDEYWAGAISNLLTVYDSNAEIPACDTYVQPEFDTNNHNGTKHSYQAEVTAPTCTANGYTTYTCTCGDTYTAYKTDALGHDIISVDAKAATCTEIGWDAYEHCSRGDYTTYSEIGALGHDWADAICTAPQTCTVCGATSGDALGHDWADATCTAPKTCKVCEDTTGDALGHDWADSTCTAPKTCKVCEDTTGDALGHDWADATCTVPQTCKVCEVTTGDALGHDEVAYEAKAATCTDFGWDAYVTCSRCDYTTYSAIDALGHDWAEATCTAPQTCKVCETTIGSANGHDWAEANCTTPMTCKTCKETLGSALGHEWKDVLTKATLTANGNIKPTCVLCNAVSKATTIYKASSIKLSATSFTYNGKVQKPTVVVKDSNGKTISSSNYTVTYASGCKNAGTYKVTIKMKGNYSGTKELTYKINPINISKCTVSISKTMFTYNGKVQKPSVTVKSPSGTKLTTSSYTVKYSSDCKNPGTYKVTITMKGNYTGSKTFTFYILPGKTSKVTAESTTTTLKATWSKVTGASGYKVELLNSSGKVVKSATTTKLTYTFSKLTAGTNYKVRVTAYKTISGKKQYSESSTTLSTATKPATPTLKVTSTKKGIAGLSWTNVAGESGYQVYYSTSKNGTYSKMGSYSTNTAKASKSKLTSGKTYYFKVRSYKKVGSTTIYGDWSKVVSVKIK